jgi:LIVCS family branched-chain amino acid:cation transporter
MLLYPLVITLVVMALAERTFGGSRHVYRWVTAGAFIAAIFDFAKTLPEGVQTALNIPAMTELAGKVFPFFDLGLGWVVPSLIGLVIGLIIYNLKKLGGDSHVDRDRKSVS